MKNVLSVKGLLLSKRVLGIIIAIAVMSISAPVFAHYIYEEGYTYSSDYECAWNRAEISHGSGGGYSKSDVEAKKVKIDYDDGMIMISHCASDFTRPIAHLRAKWMLYIMEDSSWMHCRSGTYRYNPYSASSLRVMEDFGSSPPCGAGEYMTVGYGHLKNGGMWYGGFILAGATGHTLP